MPKPDFTAIFGSTPDSVALKIIRQARADAAEAQQTGDTLGLRLAGQLGHLALISLAEDVAARLGLPKPEDLSGKTTVLRDWEESIGLFHRPYSGALDPAKELLELRSFHNAEPDAVAQVPTALAEIERLIVDGLRRLSSPA